MVPMDQSPDTPSEAAETPPSTGGATAFGALFSHSEVAPGADAQEAAADAPAKSAGKKTTAKKTTAKKATTKTTPAQDLSDSDAETPEESVEDPQKTAQASAEESAEPIDEETEAAAGAASPFGLLFQAPDLSAVPARPARTRTRTPEPEPAPSEEASDQAGDDSTESRDESEPESAGSRKRRRRGGKGRRGRGGSSDEAPGSDDSEQDSSDDSSTTSEETEASSAESSSGTVRRRRRSGRRGEDGEARESRRAREEVTGVRGSTRLEAKRQRRREGREAGRRRTIITEAEFLARRESVERTMVVRGRDDRTQIGVLEDGVLVEHYVSRATQSTMVGNVYLGRVQNVLPSMEAAFVDIGKGRNAVLYAGEVNWDAAGLDSNQPKRIENALKSGDSVLVQVTKDPIGHKGARLTSQVSLPGRYLVLVPGNSMTGISRKLPDTERARLKKILKEVVPEGAGVIVRTAAEGASEQELRADVERLTGLWDRIQGKQKSANAPALLHGEPDMTVRVIRDVFNEDFAKVVVSGDRAWKEVSDYLTDVAPDLADRLEKWTGTKDVFTHYRVTEALAKAMDRKVWLPSGGSLVIDRTEAMTVVDVNTGKFVGSGGNLEETVTKNNIEAAEEIVRQLRLRDIGGIIVIDFIDMVLESNRDLVVRRLLECLGRDRTKHQVAEVTSLGLVQMTRKRVGAGLIEVFSEPCTHCNGRGIVVHADPIDKSDGGHQHGGSGGGNRRGRGRNSESDNTSGGSSRPTPAPGGPTPAQIAAAAHAAAIAGQSTQQQDAAAVNESGAGPQDTAAVAPATPHTEEEARPVAGAEQPAPVDVSSPAATAEPSPRPRRRRGRVVAPAGPPGAADAESVTEPATTAPDGAP